MLCLLLLLGVAAARPVTYDQRQEGELNVRADLKDVVVIVALPDKKTISLNGMNLLDGLDFLKNIKQGSEPHGKSDPELEDFWNAPSQTEVVAETKGVAADGAVDVVVAGKNSALPHLELLPENPVPEIFGL